MQQTYITPDLFHDIESGKEKSKLAKRVYQNVLNYDLLSIVQYGAHYWIEKTYREARIPQYATKFIEA